MDELQPYIPLIKYKNWAEAFYLLSYLYHVSPAFVVVTKKLCWEILLSKTKWNAAYKILESIGTFTLNSKWQFIWINQNPDYSILEEEKIDLEAIKEFAWVIHSLFWWDYVTILSFSRTRKKYVDAFARRLWYDTTEYLKQVKKLIQADSFWSKVISWQTFLRKLDVLTSKFTPPKNVKDFNELSNIF